MPWNTVLDSRPPPRESGNPLARRRPKGRCARLVAVGAAAAVATVVQFPLAAQPSQPPEPAKTLSAPAATPAGDTLQSGSPLKGSQSGSDSLQPDPVPPRMLFLGAAAADARTLAAGRRYAGIGYAGADIFAQFGDLGESRPLIVHVAYGVTDDFTLAVGSGIWNYDSGGYFEGGSDSETETTFFHYVAPKLRVLRSGGVSASLGGRLIVPSGEDAEGYFYGVTMAFSATLERLAGHLSLGVHGSDNADFFGPDDDFAVTIGADYSVPLEDRAEYDFKPFAELRILGIEDEELEILIAGVRLVSGGGLAAELGFAKWFEDNTETRPVVSLAYRF